MRRINKTITIATIIITLLLTNSIMVFALPSFTDVTRANWSWAYDHIEKMKEEGIISGYSEDATFRPANNVSKLQTIVMIYSLLDKLDKLGDINTNALVSKYQNTITQNNIPDWAEKQVAFALEKNIIDTTELKTFIVNNKQTSATRSDVSIYLGKALNLYLKEDLNNKFITLSFVDSELIPYKAIHYIDLLNNKGIIKGDNNNKFNPLSPINRAAAATMLSLSYDILEDLEDEAIEDDWVFDDLEDVDLDEDWEDDDDLTYEEVTIKYIVVNSDTILVENSREKQELHSLKDIKIVIDGIVSDIEDLEQGDKVRLYYDDDDDLVKVVKSENPGNIVRGEVYEVMTIGDSNLITVMGYGYTDRNTFKVSSNTRIRLDGASAELTDIKAGDTVLIETSGQTAKEIIAQSSRRTYEGVIEKGLNFSEAFKITVKTYDGKIYDVELDPDVKVEKNDRNRTIADLSKGDLVTVTTRLNKAINIKAFSVKNEDEGTIKGITIGEEPQITILNKDGDLKTYTLASGVDIEIDRDDAELYDLKIGYKVELKLESNLVREIEAKKIETSDKLMGVITRIYKSDDYDALRLKVGSGDNAKYYSVLADDSRIFSEDLDRISFRGLEEDFEVIVYGEEKGEIFDFVADRIVIIEMR